MITNLLLIVLDIDYEVITLRTSFTLQRYASLFEEIYRKSFYSA